MNKCTTYHLSVMLAESIKGLNIQPDGVYVDVTFGGGGHSNGILGCLSQKGKLYGFDLDEAVLDHLPIDDRFTFVRGNFCYLENFMEWYGESAIDGVFADLGVSWHHFDDEKRGFSFRSDAPLDMRMNRNSPKKAADILNHYHEKQLADLFHFYGELSNAKQIAAAIVNCRIEKPILTTQDFVRVLKPFTQKMKEKKQLAQAFQAVRLEVNSELTSLKKMLVQTQRLLKPQGRLVVITYHSLEDRLVKNWMKTGNFDGVSIQDFYGNVQTPFTVINHKPIVPQTAEIENNPRARSAKLRIAEKL